MVAGISCLVYFGFMDLLDCSVSCLWQTFIRIWFGDHKKCNSNAEAFQFFSRVACGTKLALKGMCKTVPTQCYKLHKMHQNLLHISLSRSFLRKDP